MLSEAGNSTGRKLRGVIISNCQVQPLKHALSLFCKDIVFEGFAVHIIPPDRRADDVDAFMADADKYDVILSIPLDDEFGPLSCACIRETFARKRFGMIANMYFTGLHPDTAYVGGLSRRMPGPMGEYHSRVALLSYVKGLTVEQAVAQFNSRVYEALGYYSEFERSLAELRERETAAPIDVPFSDMIPGMVREGAVFHTFNHPSGLLISRYVERVAQWLDDKGYVRRSNWPSGPLGVQDHLAYNFIYPVYPEIAKRFGCPSGSYCFKPCTDGDNAVASFSLEQFVAGEYEAIADYSEAEFCESVTAKNLARDYAGLKLPL